MTNPKILTLDVDLLVDRPAAMMVECNGKKEWVPKSQCEYDGGDQTLQIPEWLAIEKGFV